MPVYEYQCESCGAVHEIIQKYSDIPVTKCPACGGSVKKLISNTSFVLKGTGWYKTDYASPGAGKGSGGEKGNGSKKEDKSQAKPEPKMESPSKAQ
jgi:putative FmdB family regulatory protein